MFNCPECSADYNDNLAFAAHYKAEHAPAIANDDTAPPLNNYEVNQYVISMALEVAKINRVDFQQACDQVRAELRKEAFTGQEVAPNA